MAEEEDKEKETIESIMGFTGFGKDGVHRCMQRTNFFLYSRAGKKTAMKFDVEKMFAETRRSAREYTQNVASEHRLAQTV